MGIIVEWKPPADPGTEYIDIDLDELRNGTEPPVRMQTTVLCPSGDGDETIWEVEVQVERKNNGRIDLVVKYDRGENPHLNRLDTGYWGINRIVLEQGQDRGNYHWKGDDETEIESEDGWRKEKLLEEKFRKCYLKIERDRNFSLKILKSDKKKCVISGECTKEALEAAHIRPVADNGADERGNGITLRRDIHRLYDKKMFFIHPESGMPKINGEKSGQLSEEYKKLLEESEGLPLETLERVSAALWEVWPDD